MKQRALFGIIAIFSISTIFFSCGSSSDDLLGNWIKRATFGGTVRSNAVSFVIGSEAYVGTGSDGDDLLTNFRKFDADLDLWSAASDVAPLLGSARQSAVGFAAGGKGYVGTGIDENTDRLSDFWEYDPSTNIWVQIADLPGGARQEAVAFGIGSFGYVGTGYGFLDGADKKHLNDFWKLNSATGEWTNLPYGGEKVRGASAFVIGNSAYICLGTNNNGVEVTNLYKFDADSGTWEEKNKLDKDDKDSNIPRTNAVTFVINGKGYVASGSADGGFLQKDVWEYDPATDKWTEKTGLEPEILAREYAVGFSVSNRGFMATGIAGSKRLDDVWEFDPTMEENEDDN